MPYFTDATDDVLSVAVTPSFDGGQVSGISPNLIADNAASELLTMTISPNGTLQTRQGIETVSTSFSTANTVQGMFYFDTPNLETIVVGTNGTLYKYNTGSTTFSTTGGTVVNSTSQIEFAQLNNKLFVTDADSTETIVKSNKPARKRLRAISSNKLGIVLLEIIQFLRSVKFRYLLTK